MHLNNGLDIPPRNRDILETSILEILRTYNASMWLAGPGNGEGNYVDSLGSAPLAGANELVGYVQDKMSSEQAENVACNTEFAGATVGLAANALPGYAGVISAGLLSSIVGVGSGFVDVRLFGTATVANDYLIMEPLASVSKAIAILGEDAIAAVTASYTPGAVQIIPRSILLSCVARNGANVPLASTSLNITSLLTEIPTRFVARTRVANATAAVCTLSFRVVAVQIGDVFDFTLRLSDYKIAKGNSDTPVKNTALTPLYRTNSYISLNQATTGFKPILAGGMRNELINSRTFSTWSQTGPGTVTLNAAKALDGSMTATLIERTGTAALFFSRHGTRPGTAAISFSGAVVAKPGINGRFITVRLQGVYPAYSDVMFDMHSGTVVYTKISGGMTLTKYSMSALKDGYWLCRMVTVDPGGSSAVLSITTKETRTDLDTTAAAGDFSDIIIDNTAMGFSSNFFEYPFPVNAAVVQETNQAPYSWKFDGVDNRFVHTVPPINPNGDHFFIVAFRMPPTPIVDARWVLGLGNAGSSERAGIVFVSNSQVVGFWRDTGAANLNSITLGAIRAVNERLVATARRNGATFWGSVRGDIGASATGSTPVTVTAWIPTLSVIGAGVSLGTANFFYGAEIYAVIEGNGAPTAGELLAMENFLAGHAGFTPLP